MEAEPAKAEKSEPLRIPTPRQLALGGVGVLAAAFTVFGAWAALAPLSGAVIASGFVKVDNSRKTVAHLEGGIVKEILVRDGTRVKQGDVLLVMQDATVSASVDLLGGQLAAEIARSARFRAERDGSRSVKFPVELTEQRADPKMSEIMEGEVHLFNVRRRALEEQVRVQLTSDRSRRAGIQ